MTTVDLVSPVAIWKVLKNCFGSLRPAWNTNPWAPSCDASMVLSDSLTRTGTTTKLWTDIAEGSWCKSKKAKISSKKLYIMFFFNVRDVKYMTNLYIYIAFITNDIYI
jgi:hypothetical protein